MSKLTFGDKVNLRFIFEWICCMNSFALLLEENHDIPQAKVLQRKVEENYDILHANVLQSKVEENYNIPQACP